METLRVLGALAVGTALLLTTVQGCSSSKPSDTASQPNPAGVDHASKLVGPEGGTVATDDGNATVDIPPGALPANTTITIQSNPTAPAPGSASSVGTPYTFGPDGLVFLKPVTVTLAFDSSRLPAGATSAMIVVFTAPDGATKYDPLPTSVKDGTHVVATTMHFSTDVPGVMTQASDAGDCFVSCVEAPACAVVCGGDAGPGGSACQCTSSCDGHAYEVACVNGACSCTTDGKATKSFNDSTICSGTAYGSCGYPGSVSGGAVTYECQATCDGHQYDAVCASGSCTCKQDGVQTKTAAASAQASYAGEFASYSQGCAFPGQADPGASGGGDSGAGSDGGAGDGGGSDASSGDASSGDASSGDASSGDASSGDGGDGGDGG